MPFCPASLLLPPALLQLLQVCAYQGPKVVIFFEIEGLGPVAGGTRQDVSPRASGLLHAAGEEDETRLGEVVEVCKAVEGALDPQGGG